MANTVTPKLTVELTLEDQKLLQDIQQFSTKFEQRVKQSEQTVNKTRSQGAAERVANQKETISKIELLENKLTEKIKREQTERLAAQRAFANKVSASLAAMTASATAFAVAYASMFVGSAIRSSIQFAGNLKDTADNLKITTRQVYALQEALIEQNVPAEALVTLFSRLNNILDGSELTDKQASILDSLGLDAESVTSIDLLNSLIIDSAASAELLGGKLSLVVQALKQTGSVSEIEKTFPLKISPEELSRLDAYGTLMQELTREIQQGFAKAFADPQVFDSFRSFITQLVEGIQKIDFRGFAQGLLSIVNAIALIGRGGIELSAIVKTITGFFSIPVFEHVGRALSSLGESMARVSGPMVYLTSLVLKLSDGFTALSLTKFWSVFSAGLKSLGKLSVYATIFFVILDFFKAMNIYGPGFVNVLKSIGYALANLIIEPLSFLVGLINKDAGEAMQNWLDNTIFGLDKVKKKLDEVSEGWDGVVPSLSYLTVVTDKQLHDIEELVAQGYTVDEAWKKVNKTFFEGKVILSNYEQAIKDLKESLEKTLTLQELQRYQSYISNLLTLTVEPAKREVLVKALQETQDKIYEITGQKPLSVEISIPEINFLPLSGGSQDLAQKFVKNLRENVTNLRTERIGLLQLLENKDFELSPSEKALIKKRLKEIWTSLNPNNFDLSKNPLDNFLGVESGKVENVIKPYVQVYNGLTDLANNYFDLQAAGVQAQITAQEKLIRIEQERWASRSENLRRAGLESSAFYRNEQLRNEALQERQQKKLEALQAEAFDKEKEGRRVSTVLAGANAFVNALTTAPFLAGLALSVLAAAQTAAQLSIIDSQENPYRRAFGGLVPTNGRPNSDSVPVLAQGGEFVMNRRATSQNLELLEAINNGRNPSTSPTVNITVNGNFIGTREQFNKEVVPLIKEAVKSGALQVSKA